MKKYWAAFNRFEIELEEDDARSGSHRGDCYNDVASLIEKPYIKGQLDEIDPDEIRKELHDYGAWDDEELEDDYENRIRAVWCACGDIVERELLDE